MSVDLCPICDGQGWTLTDDGAAPCECQRAARRATRIALAEATITDRYRRCSRANWDTNRAPWPLDSECDSWPAEPGRDPWALVLLGERGVGKTHVATARFRELAAARERRSALWISHDEIVECSKAEIRGERRNSIERELGQVELLLLDDVGRTRATPHSIELIRAALYLRHARLLPTILTSNARALDDFDAFDPALSSRLHEGTMVFVVGGADQRRRVA